MRHIHKGTEPALLAAWKALASNEWTPAFSDLRSEEKAATLQALLREQGFICCYCERRITDRRDCHIEHASPQSVEPKRALDFGNMLGSCQGEPPPEPSHCGHARGNNSLDVHPLLPDCREYFEFDSFGLVRPALEPARREPALRTIGALRLNSPKLVRARRAAIDGLLADLVSPEPNLNALIHEVDQRDGVGQHLPFCSALVAVLRAYS